MLVTLIGKNKIHKIILPKNPIGNYWMKEKENEKEKKLVNIEGKDGNWQIITDKKVYTINPSALIIENDKIKISKRSETVADRIILKEYNMYAICIGGIENFYIVYCSPAYEEYFSHLNIRNTGEIFIGKSPKNTICYENKLVASTHARIFYEGGAWNIENFDKKLGTFVNNSKVNSSIIKLNNGDEIFIMGLKIILMGDSIFINNPQGNLKFNTSNLIQSKEINNEYIKKEIENSEDNTIEIYSEKDYFARVPRVKKEIEPKKIKIEEPPAKQDNEKMPFMLVFGSSLTMALTTLITASRAIDGYNAGTSTFKNMIFQLVTSLSMLMGILLMPIINYKYTNKKNKEKEIKRQEKYREYINKKIDIIGEEMNRQRNLLLSNYVATEECINIILNKSSRLWERKTEDYDFLHIRLGIGEVPLSAELEYPEEKFFIEEDELREILNKVVNKSKILIGAPIVLSLAEKNISAIMSKDIENAKKMIKNIIIQLIAFHNYEDLKLVFLLKEDENKQWEYAKMLPHVWNSTKEIRFFAENQNEMEEISSYLEDELKERLEQKENNKDIDYKTCSPYYLIIIDDYKKVQNVKIIKEILKQKENLGFGILCITNDMLQLPNETKTFINLKEKEGEIIESISSENNEKKFLFNFPQFFRFDEICKKLSNIPIRYIIKQKKESLPTNYSFLEMYDAGLIEQLNILERWEKNDSTLSLKTPIGVNENGKIIYLDVHEKYHGPHGLIAGSTGSGKSEFIITYILSLAVNYHPYDVSFILIDYKGGGLAGAFEKNNIRLPHIVGTITNVDTAELNRSLTSIQSELRKRQIMFNEARNMTDEGTIDIYKYQRLFHDGIVKNPIPHLFIICDEFAELKQQQPEFMDELMSVSRIGRSLGVHLILATQKPAGIVNEQIRSNSRFAICLKVQNKSDSKDVIGKPDAAYLSGQGQFYIQVGNDEYFELGKSAWSGAPYIPSNTSRKIVDTSIKFISNTGSTIKQVDNNQQHIKSLIQGEQLTKIVQYICDMAKREKIKPEKLWLDSIPETIYLQDIRKKYKVENKDNIICSVIGEYDDPNNQRQGVLKINFSNNGNLVVYGNAESGKETLLSTMCFDLINNYTSQNLWIYILDFGSEALKIYRDAPQVGDVVFINEEEKIERFFDMISKEIKTRKEILSKYNGDYELYLKKQENAMPMIVIMLNNFVEFMEMYETKYEDTINNITRECTKYRIVFAVTTNVSYDIRYRLKQNFKQSITLQQNKDDEYTNIFSKARKIRPASLFGRGLTSIDDNIYEFQTAVLCEAEEYNNYIYDTIQKVGEIKENKLRPKPIGVLPDIVTLELMKKDITSINSIPLGLTKKEIETYNYDFKKNFVTVITGIDIEEISIYLVGILKELLMIPKIGMTIIDAEASYEKPADSMNEQLNTFIDEFNVRKNSKDHNLCVIVGIDKFIERIGLRKTEFYKYMQEMKQCKNYSFIIVDSVSKIKNRTFDDWYKNFVINDSAIWVGSGFADQYLIRSNMNLRNIENDCGRCFGYVVSKRDATFIKLLGMKEKEKN